MHRMPKLVHHPHFLQLIPAPAQHLKIPRQGSRIAAHIHDSLRPHGKHGCKALLIAAFSGRIHHDHIRMPFLFFKLLFCIRLPCRIRSASAHHLRSRCDRCCRFRLFYHSIILLYLLSIKRRQHFLRLTHVKFHVPDSVEPCILLRVLDGLRNHFDPMHLLRPLRHKKRNCPDSAVQIPDRLSAGKARILHGQAVQFLSLARIYLIKRQRRYGKCYPLLSGFGRPLF